MKEDGVARTAREIGMRAVVLHACCTASYGYPRDAAMKWIQRNGLGGSLTFNEHRFLRLGTGNDLFRLRPEAVWALCWVLLKVERFTPAMPMPRDAALPLPSLAHGESAAPWLDSCTAVRGDAEVLDAYDFCSCGRELPTLADYVATERRRAFEWCCGTAEWDEIAAAI